MLKNRFISVYNYVVVLKEMEGSSSLSLSCSWFDVNISQVNLFRKLNGYVVVVTKEMGVCHSDLSIYYSDI